jgi:hypothetical protein
MRGLILLFCLALFLFSNIGAYELGVSPPRFEFNLSSGERQCGGITIFSDNYVGGLILTDNLDNSLKVNYPDRIYLDKNSKVSFCVIANEIGRFEGNLLFRTENANIEVGCKINVHVFENLAGEGSLITGNSIFDDLDVGGRGTIFAVSEGLFLAICLAVLFFLFRKARKH